MILFSFLCIAIGVYPAPLYALLPYPVDFVPYTYGHVMESLQLLLFSGLAFFVTLPLMKRTLTLSLDFDWFYRKFGFGLAKAGAEATSRAIAVFYRARDLGVNRLLDTLSEHHGPRGVLARATPAGVMVTWVIALLLVYLVIYLFI